MQRPVEVALYGGLVAGELGEGVRAVGVPYEGQTELRRVRVPYILVELPGEYAGLHPSEAAHSPEEGGDPVHEKVLEISDGLQLASQAFAQLD